MPLKQAEAHLYATAQAARDACLTVYTWKEDRWVEVERVGEEITLREHGYQDGETVFGHPRELKHALKDACAREFPRSNKVHVNERGR